MIDALSSVVWCMAGLNDRAGLAGALVAGWHSEPTASQHNAIGSGRRHTTGMRRISKALLTKYLMWFN